MKIIAAATLTRRALLEAFNAGFSEYVVPLQMTEEAFAEHLDVNAIDLACSCVLADSEPVAFALIGCREKAAWVGGMGTAPSHRGRGLGERTLRAAIDAAAANGAASVWLEVITRNDPAIALYEKLGFEPVRDLIVWSLPAGAETATASDSVDIDTAHAWIAAHRRSREPWQRSDASLARLRDRRADLRGRMITRGGSTVAAVIARSRGRDASVVQIAADDERAAADALAAALAGHDELRVANVAVDELPSRALRRLGARELVRQHELRLRL